MKALPPVGDLITPAGIARSIAAVRRNDAPTIIGLTGSVAVGKSILAGQIAAELAPLMRVAIVATDAWLLPNDRLAALGLTLKKGFPQSYDIAALAAFLTAARLGPVTVPGYSHRIYDVDPALARRLEPPDLLIVEGLGFSDGGIADQLDALLYLDADIADLERWFTARFLRFWHAAADDPTSFYARFRGMSEAEASIFGRRVWHEINRANLDQHIIRARPLADIVIKKAGDHRLFVGGDA